MARLFSGDNNGFLKTDTNAPVTSITGTAVTVAGWSWFDEGDAGVGTICGIEGAGVGDVQFSLRIESVRKPSFQIGDAGSYDQIISPSLQLTNQAWRHVAGVKDGTGANALRVYGQGSLFGQTTSNRTIADQGLPLTIGGRASGDVLGYTGNIAHCAVWDAALTAEEIAALAAGVLPPLIRPANLKAYWPVTGFLGTGSSGAVAEYDYSGNGNTLLHHTVTSSPSTIDPPPTGLWVPMPQGGGF